MSRIKIQPADSHALHVIQAMSCNGQGKGCYPAFNASRYHFLIAEDGPNIVGFICAYPAKGANHAYLQLMEPYVYTARAGKGIEDKLREEMLKWGEEKCGLRFYKDKGEALSPMRSHDLHDAHHEIPLENTIKNPPLIVEEEITEPVDNRDSERISAWQDEPAFI